MIRHNTHGMEKPDSYSALERRFLGPARGVLLRLIEPIVRLLALLRVSPVAVTLLGPALGLAFVFVVPRDPHLGFWIWLPSMLVDGIDGALARYTGKASDFGALLDQVCDHTREVLIVAGLARAGGLSPAWGSLYPFAYTALNVVLFLCNWHNVPLPFAVKSYWTLYPVIALYLWTGRNCLDAGAALSILFMTGAIVHGLLRLSSGMRGE